MSIPTPRAARLSGYTEQGQLLPWQWLDARMGRARNYWIASHSALRHPHARPVWGVWMSPQLMFSTGSLIGHNLRANPHVQVNLESADEVVIIEGRARPLESAEAASWAADYNRKYHWDMPVSTDGVWVIVPTRALAWLSDPSGLDRGAGFSNSATEWRFD